MKESEKTMLRAEEKSFKNMTRIMVENAVLEAIFSEKSSWIRKGPIQ